MTMDTHETSQTASEGRSSSRPALALWDEGGGLPALALAGSGRGARLFSWILAVLFALLLAGIVVLPWQQFVGGTGRVVAYDPLERAVNVESPLPGRVSRAHVVEGKAVKQGDTLFEIVDNDPNLLGHLGLQREAALVRKAAATDREGAIARQIEEQQRSLRLSIEAARTRLDAARYAADTARLQFERIDSLYRDRRGLASQREFELATLERDRTAAELVRAQADLQRTETDGLATLNSVAAAREAARADLASASQAVVSLDIQISQNAMQRVVAPRDGVVFRVTATEGTYLRAGSPLCTLIPETESRMVELWIDGNDMPLVRSREVGPDGKPRREGSPVRVQFEGWPAVQFAGWPSVAVGTFGGEVVLVDPTDNGKGKFRVLVAPKPDRILRGGSETALAWPANRWLRQGVRANGWVLLERVPLWFEIWRQLNGFPPVVSGGEPGKDGGNPGR
ncbi:MAG: HlyD family efflux transporter periplasmic adaptor subunit [Verrucomicrobia bacterium]|nr:MAG: HlyD family efflux transporter periplasmic adaptor subunit [Verrucomicrobiota bacterium]